jgi:hypothetical protein
MASRPKDQPSVKPAKAGISFPSAGLPAITGQDFSPGDDDHGGPIDTCKSGMEKDVDLVFISRAFAFVQDPCVLCPALERGRPGN